MARLVDISALLAVRRKIEKMSIPERKSFIASLMPGTRTYGDEFVVIPSGSGAHCAIVDLRSKQLCWIEFKVTVEEALARMTDAGSVEELRNLIVEKLKETKKSQKERGPNQ
jgi:hypothetical protein